MNNTLQQISGAIGTAVLVTVMNNRMETKGHELADAAAASGKSLNNPEVMKELTQQATLDGITFSFLVSTFIAAVALLLALFMKRAKPPQTDKALMKKCQTE